MNNKLLGCKYVISFVSLCT